MSDDEGRGPDPASQREEPSTDAKEPMSVPRAAPSAVRDAVMTDAGGAAGVEIADDLAVGRDDRVTLPPDEDAGEARESELSERAPRFESSLLTYIQRRPDPLTSLLLTVPIFLVYHLGILLIDKRNAADLISTLAFSLLEQSQLAYLGVTFAYVAGIAGAAFFLRRSGKIETVSLLPIVVESTIYAILLTISVGWVTAQVFSAQVGEATEAVEALNPVAKLVLASGAGFHEELLFRALLFGGMAFALQRFAKRKPWEAAVIAALVSSLAFSAAHYFGELGDSFTFASFFFRFLAGLYFAAVFRFRGFAVAVYTHAIYDFLVFFVL